MAIISVGNNELIEERETQKSNKQTNKQPNKNQQ